MLSLAATWCRNWLIRLGVRDENPNLEVQAWPVHLDSTQHQARHPRVQDRSHPGSPRLASYGAGLVQRERSSLVLDRIDVGPTMITKAMCEKRALELRVRAFDEMDRRNWFLVKYEVALDEYPGWVRNMDKRIGDLFAQADELIRLVNGPAWRRWLR